VNACGFFAASLISPLVTGLDAVQYSNFSRYRRPTSAAFAAGHLDRRSVVNCNIFNSKGVHVGVVTGDAVFGLRGQKLYELKGSNVYKLNGDLVGHLPDTRDAAKRLDKATDKLFPAN
jgi:hypothetical protein